MTSAYPMHKRAHDDALKQQPKWWYRYSVLRWLFLPRIEPMMMSREWVMEKRRERES
jgi:hypothetical protein